LATLDLIRTVGYDQAFLFAYSLRDRTHAAHKMEDDVPEEVKKRRLQEMIETWRSDTTCRNEQNERDFVPSFGVPGAKIVPGRLHLVLVEGAAKRPLRSAAGVEQAALTGRTDTNKRILFTDQPVELLEASAWGLGGSSGMFTQGAQLNPGDYAVVRVTGVAGHTLRGEPLAKTTLGEWSHARHLSEWAMA